jgi:hypothetical protein
MDTRQRVLAWINKQRRDVGAEPIPELRPGLPLDSDHCPIAETFDNDFVIEVTVTPSTIDDWNGRYKLRRSGNEKAPWGNLTYYKDDLTDYKSISLPKYVAQFAADFDSNRFPDLIG